MYNTYYIILCINMYYVLVPPDRYSTGKVEYTLDWLWTNLRWSEVGKPPQCWMQRRCWLPQRGFVRCRH